MSDDSSVREFGRLIWRLLPGAGKPLLLLFLVTLVHELVKFIPPYLLKLIIDGVFASAPLVGMYPLVVGVFVSLFVLLLIEMSTLRWIVGLAADKQRSILERLFTKMMRLPIGWHERQNTGTLVSKTTKASNYINQMIWFLNNDLLPSALQLVLTAAVLLFVDWRIGLVFVLFTPVYLFFIDRQFRQVQPFREKYHEAYDESTRELAQSLYNVQTVKDYGQEAREERTHKGFLDKYVHWSGERARFEFRRVILRDVFMHAGRAGLLGLTLWLVYQGRLTPGDLVFVFTLTEKAFINLFRMGRIYMFMGDTYEALARADQITRTDSELVDDGVRKPLSGDIVLTGVDFDYGKEPVLRGIDVTFKMGKTTALVGPSGSGKTTLVKLLMRHYDPTEGVITLGGDPLPELSLERLRRRISFVSQHTEIFDRSISDNIAYGLPHASRAQVIRAAKQANAHEFISSFPDGYDTLVGERGVRLSGGQRQRISIARALLAGADIIIFDEATSSLDSESERSIQDAVLKMRGKTLIVIAHRLSTIEHADSIVVLNDGRVAEQGNHKDLMRRRSGIYRRMRRLQSLGQLRA